MSWRILCAILLLAACASSLSAVSVRAMPVMPSAAPLEAYLKEHLAVSDRLEAGERLSALLREHAELTRQAVNAAPWRGGLSFELVCRYILPIRVAQEPQEPWRGALARELTPIAHAAPTPLKAAELIRKWLCARVKPGASYPWDLGPLALLRAGSGRCEEIGILFVCAARAVGLPARICYTPAWRDMADNHLWVEVWDGARWRLLSPEQPDAPADTGWFLPHTEKAALILAKGFGTPSRDPSAGETILKADRTGFLLNRTPAYALCGRLRISISGTETAEPPRIQIFVRNGLKLSPVAELFKTADVELGTGSYLVTASTPSSFACALATVLPQQHTILSLRPEPLPTGKALPGADDLLAPTGKRVRQGQYGAAHLPLNDALFNQWEGFAPAAHRHAPTQPGPAALGLPDFGESWGTWLDSTSRAYADEVATRREYATALAAWRRMYPEHTNQPEMRTRFMREILPGRVGKEPFSHWRQAMTALTRQCVVPGNPDHTRQCLRRWADALPLAVPDGKREIYGAPLSLSAIAKHAAVTTAEEREWAFKAATRAAGLYEK